MQDYAYSVGTSSKELTGAADSLAQGSVTQASSINQLVLNVEDMAECIARNSVSEEQAKNLSNLISGFRV